MRGATGGIWSGRGGVIVSIHAPVRGATCIGVLPKPRSASFNPRPREGGDVIIGPIRRPVQGFNPRPREGGDRPSSQLSHAWAGFNPRPREGGDAVEANCRRGGRQWVAAANGGGAADELRGGRGGRRPSRAGTASCGRREPVGRASCAGRSRHAPGGPATTEGRGGADRPRVRGGRGPRVAHLPWKPSAGVGGTGLPCGVGGRRSPGESRAVAEGGVLCGAGVRRL